MPCDTGFNDIGTKTKSYYITVGLSGLDERSKFMTDLKVWPLLSTCSKRAMLRTRKKWGHPNNYKPRVNLLNRLTEQLGMSREQVLSQIEKEKKYLQQYSRYYL